MNVFFTCVFVIIIIYIAFVWFIKIVYNLLLVAVAVVVVDVLGILVYCSSCCNIICYWVAFVVVINPWRFFPFPLSLVMRVSLPFPWLFL